MAANPFLTLPQDTPIDREESNTYIPLSAQKQADLVFSALSLDDTLGKKHVVEATDNHSDPRHNQPEAQNKANVKKMTLGEMQLIKILEAQRVEERKKRENTPRKPPSPPNPLSFSCILRVRQHCGLSVEARINSQTASLCSDKYMCVIDSCAQKQGAVCVCDLERQKCVRFPLPSAQFADGVRALINPKVPILGVYACVWKCVRVGVCVFCCACVIVCVWVCIWCDFSVYVCVFCVFWLLDFLSIYVWICFRPQYTSLSLSFSLSISLFLTLAHSLTHSLFLFLIPLQTYVYSPQTIHEQHIDCPNLRFTHAQAPAFITIR